MSDQLAATMGTFEEWNWNRAQLHHMLKELARGMYDDAGDEFGGLTAVAGLNVAVIANEGRLAEDANAGILHHIGWLAAILASDAPTEDQRLAFRAIVDATDAWKR